MTYRRWTKEEVKYLRQNFKIKDMNIITKQLNRTELSVYKKAVRLGLTEILKRWEEGEVEYLINNWGKKPMALIAKYLDRSKISVKKKALEYNLGPQYIANGEYLTSGDIGYILNKSPNIVYKWINKGLIEGKRFGQKGIYQVKPKDFLLFLKNYPEKWNGCKVRVEYIKPYFMTSNCSKQPQWFTQKVEKDKKLSRLSNTYNIPPNYYEIEYK